MRNRFGCSAWLSIVVLVAVATATAACGGGAAKAAADNAAAAPAATDAPPATEAALPETLRAILSQDFTGDLDEMVKRRVIRIGAPFNRMFYFVDQGVRRGASYELGKAFGGTSPPSNGPGVLHDLILYVIDNDIHHRGQGYVYLRASGIASPPFYER
jgi:DinB family